MFDLIADKFSDIFAHLAKKGRLSESDIDETLRKTKISLLEADVHFGVVKEFTSRLKQKLLQAELSKALNPTQQVVKIIHQELTTILGGENSGLINGSKLPNVVMLIGLQGSGKTTTAVKLAYHLKNHGQKPFVVACDLRRPAAIEQVVDLCKRIGVGTYSESGAVTVSTVAERGVKKAKELGSTWVILDTGGRLHIDDDLIQEINDVKTVISLTEVILVLDGITGQDAVKTADDFHNKVGVTGLVLTKLDGDARGGAAFSITHTTGIPIKFIGVGEKPGDLEPFHPERISSRILGMGDVLTLAEKAQDVFDNKKAKELEKKVLQSSWTLVDFLDQLLNLKKMGSIDQIMEMIPGFRSMANIESVGSNTDVHIKKMEAIILSMTNQERQNPSILDGSRKKRVAIGSGTSPQDVNALLSQFKQMQKMMKNVGKLKRLPGFPQGFKN